MMGHIYTDLSNWVKILLDSSWCSNNLQIFIFASFVYNILKLWYHVEMVTNHTTNIIGVFIVVAYIVTMAWSFNEILLFIMRKECNAIFIGNIQNTLEKQNNKPRINTIRRSWHHSCWCARKQYQIPKKYCTPVMFARFVYALLGFRVHKFPSKTEKKPGTFIAYRRLY